MKKTRRPTRPKPFRQPKQKLYPQAPPPSGQGPFHTDTSLGATRLAWQGQEEEPSGELEAAGHTEPAPAASVTDARPQPTLYPAELGGPVIVQNQITINIHSTEFRELNETLNELLHEMRRSRSNEIAGEVRDQLIAEITAGTTLLKAPKVDQGWIDFLLVGPLKYITDKGGSAMIGKLATAALDWLFKLLS